MKKSVKKVLAALLSVLLFASLFTTTAFAAHPFATDDAVAAARKDLNDAIDSIGAVYVMFDPAEMAVKINNTYLIAAKGVTNGYTVLAYQAMQAHVEEFQTNLKTLAGNIQANINALAANLVNNNTFYVVG